MAKDVWARLWATVALCACMAACGGGGDSSGGSDSGSSSGGSGGSGSMGSGSGGSGSGGGTAPGVVTANLASGSYFEFLATSSSTSATPSGTSGSSDYGIFRIALGSPMVVGGVSGFATTVTGKTVTGGVDFRPNWTFLGLSGQRWVGSSDNTNLVTLYDPALPAGTTGFFLKVPAPRSVSARAATFDGAYNDYPGISLSDASSDGGCRTVASVTICSDSATSFAQSEYLEDGIGPVGYRRSINYTVGGSAPQIVNSSVTLELIGSSLSPRDGSTIKPPPWAEVAAMPVPRVSAVAAAVGSRIYVYGGYSSEPGFDGKRVDVYDIPTGTWSRGADAPLSLTTYQTVPLGNRVALIGPRSYLHDPAAGTWTLIAPPPLPSSSTVTGAGPWTRSDGSIDVVAVVDPGSAYVNATLYRYTVAGNAWSAIGTFEKGPITSYEVAIAGNTLYAIGGYGGGSYLRNTIAVDLAALRYHTLRASLADGVINHSTVVLAGKVYVVGGYNRAGGKHSVQVVDPATESISAGPSLFASRYSAATAVAGGKLYVMGGTLAGSSSTSSNSVAVLTLP